MSELLALGCAATFGALGSYLAGTGVLGDALRTAFIEPPAILRQLAPAYRSPMQSEVRTFAGAMWPLVALAIAGAIARWRRMDVFTAQLLVWTGVGAALVDAEVWSYYYKFFILIVPIGLLAAGGLEALWTTAAKGGRFPRIAIAALLLIMLASSTRTIARVQSGLRTFAREQHDAVSSSVAFLDRADARSGPIYVFGDPRLYYFSGRDQAIAINGYSPALLLPARWHELVRELEAAAPPYIMIERDYEPSVHVSSATMRFIASSYRVAYASSDGTWYEHR